MASSVLLKKKNQCVSLLMILTPVLISLLLLRWYKNDSWTMLRPKDTTNFHSPVVVQAEAETETKTSGSMATTEIFGVKIERNPTESKLAELGVRSWPKWGCSPSKFPWTFSARETMYLLEGKVKVYCDGHDGFFEIGAGDLVEFPKGMKVTWDVIAAVSKHYSLEK